MSWAKAALRVSSVMALPPYLMTTSAPRKRSSQGSASTSVVALERATRRAAASIAPRSVVSVVMVGVARSPSGGVGGVLVDVVVGEVVGPDGHLVGAGVQVDLDPHVAAPEVDERAVLAHTAPAAHRDAVDRHVELVRLEGGRRRADGREHPPPVGALAADRALEEGAAGDAPGPLAAVG